MGQLQSKSLHRLSMEQFEQETTALTLELGHEFGNATAVFDAAALSALVERLVQWAGYRPPAATALAWMEVLNEPQPPASSALQTESIANDDESSGENAAEDLPILNSFFVYDLTQARRALKQPAPPRALQAYLAKLMCASSIWTVQRATRISWKRCDRAIALAAVGHRCQANASRSCSSSR